MKRKISVILVICVLLCSVLSACGEVANDPDKKDVNEKNSNGFAVALASYPELPKYPTDEFGTGYAEWSQAYKELRGDVFDNSPIADFIAKTARAFLTGNESSNAIYSPTNVYIALAMLAEIGGGETRTQILDLLGADSAESLRTYVNALWNRGYCDDGTVSEIQAASLWMNDSVEYKKDVLKTLADFYRASSFSGKCGDPEYDKALRGWINEQTGGLLKDATDNIAMDVNTVLELITTIYFSAKWDGEFEQALNTDGTFNNTCDEFCTYMHRTIANGRYLYGDNFGSVTLDFTNSGGMSFFLPNEGTAPEDLLDDSEFLNLLFGESKYDWEKSKNIRINFTMPKFDVKSDIELSKKLESLGVTNCFDVDKADFTTLTDSDAAVTKVSHCARVSADEQGVIAAAFTEIALCGSALPPEEEMDFTLDRPFVFVINDAVGTPIFIGVVNHVE